MDSALANNRAKGNRQRGLQDHSREWRQAPLWFNITTVPDNGDNKGRGLCSIEREYKETEVKAAVKLFQNRDPMMKLICDFEKCAESVGHQSLTKEAAKYAGEYGLQLKLQYLDPACVTEEGEVITREKLKSHLTKKRELGLKRDVGAQKWQGNLITAREEDE